ncbi:MAG: phosphatidylserine decarboxylase [Elusimicrobia bacterium]|nr:phosphatidylserine decarboxylase [Elusimicrobiota bacterium]
MEIETPRGRVVVRQIAGLIARRILCWARPEETLAPGERFGLIRFGSQVDLYLPADVEILVGVGQRVVGGVTAVARWGGHP